MKAPSIGQLNRKVKLCRQSDVVDDGKLCLRRTDIRDVWAQIKPTNIGAVWTASGHNAEDKPTHMITLRAMPDLSITHMAWFYEARGLAEDRWYKITDATESADVQWWSFKVLLDSRTDDRPPESQDACLTAKDLGLARKSGVRL